MKRLLQKISSFCIKDEGLSPYQRYSVRLVNAICIFIIAAKIIEDIFTFPMGDATIIVRSLLSHAGLLLVIFLNCRRKIQAAKIVFTIILLGVLLSIPFTLPLSLNGDGMFLVFIVIFFSIYDSWAAIIPITLFIIFLLFFWHIGNHYGILHPTESYDPQQLFYLGIVYNFMMIAALLITLFASKRMTSKYQNELKRNLEEKDVLIKEVHHRVKNNLQVIVSMLGIQETGENSIEALDVIRDLKARVVTMSIIHNRIYATKDFKYIEVKDYVTELANLTAAMFGNPNIPVEKNIDIDFVQTGLEISIPLGLIVTEVIANSIKHAFTQGVPAIIDISGKSQEEYFVLTIKDNGKGMDLQRESNDSLGLLLIELLCKQIKAKLTRENNSGLQTTITFKK
ncbi:MAG: sensor histidine kinase [Chitinophagaceae bacterium]